MLRNQHTYANFISLQKAYYWVPACEISFFEKLINHCLGSCALIACHSLFYKLVTSFLLVPFPEYTGNPVILSDLEAFSKASHKLSCGPHRLSLSFLESQPAQLATPTLTLAFPAYFISLNCHNKRLQGCLVLCVSESA